MPQAARTLELFAEMLFERRVGANEGMHARLRHLLSKAGLPLEASALERAHGRGKRDIANHSDYVLAFLAARARLPSGSPRLPAPFPPISPESVVHGRTWRMFRGCAADLAKAYGEERRLLLVTATCRDMEGIAWRTRLKRVTERRDRILEALDPHRVWAASIFDVQKPGKGSDDLSPHWHVLFATDAAKTPEVLRLLKEMRSSAVKVNHCDREGWKGSGALLPDERRRLSWLCVLTYCAKAFAPCPVAPPTPEWRAVLAAVTKERGFKARRADEALAARAAHSVNGVKAKFCRKDAKVKALPPPRFKAPARVVAARPPGRPRANLPAAVLAKVARVGRKGGWDGGSAPLYCDT